MSAKRVGKLVNYPATRRCNLQMDEVIYIRVALLGLHQSSQGWAAVPPGVWGAQKMIRSYNQTR